MRLRSLLYAALNVPVRSLLRSPLHGLASRHLALLHYRGRRSGRAFETPLSYDRDGSLVRLLSSHNTRWWHNFRAGPLPVEVEIARERHPGTARLIEHEGERLRDGVRSFLNANPRDAIVYGIRLDARRRPRESDLARLEGRVVLVEVELEGPTDA